MESQATPKPGPPAWKKNLPFRRRLGFAWSGIKWVARGERSFRTQLCLGAGAIAAAALLRPALVWTAILILAIALVLALEAVNAALEAAIDRLHPGFSPEIGRAKDAAAGAVLLAAIAALAAAAMMLASRL